ncbi:hypothetical protein P175DRAFT_0510150 [Aspergillus ochraceoroseus IBT 24754]|uniref:Flocculation suppression protein n=3 Tax=Aspergillus subgen. Nidulantes TaxID=2720870 RepID=A0A0F8X2Q2_9EURO|nr:uncharacterized protein P175DRAFT_0510150 [Aspergillus ochraceoroseus IBT 24754]KKK17817.1 flocculation suppression protein [Aspergillus rambellii]KKK25150.1 flocculation suppression protein [Aspergillus ochraceoroseus]PTU20216.1 hypothetical protein P175DRAFT_0510150 [Aspergillus ochraceoroseus IBT 24754]
MSGLADPQSRNTIISGATDAPGRTRKLPVLSSSIPSSGSLSSDPMDITPPASAATAGTAPPVHSSPDSDRAGANTVTTSNGSPETGNLNNHATQNPAIGAAAAAQQPKVVQTAFIHKLYNMLEDQSIQHLISWSGTNDSFVMSPTSEFSKVLAQYFKHTNISSFVRQLNMYGFHKVSDVFHTGSPDSALWEFKHGNGNFKRGDLVGLREIKRRASRHALIHRDSFPGHKAAVSQPGTPAEPVSDTETRLMNVEHLLFDMHNRLSRAEEGNVALNARCQAMAESITRCYHWTHSISRFLQGMIPDRESLLYRDVSSMQAELEKHLDAVRALEHPADVYLNVRQPHVPSVAVDPGPPLSPRQMPQEDSRRPSMIDPSRPNMIRPPVPAHLAVSPRRYGSIGAANSSPNYNRPQVPSVITPQPPVPHPLSSASSPPGPNLARRHTSADIRQHGWPPPGVSPFTPQVSTQGPGPWPPSPHRTPTSTDQQVRDVLAQYEMGAPRRLQDVSRHATPPLNPDQPGPTDNGWGFGAPRFPRHESSLPATRRSSMASNVHSLLNPADTAERPDEDLHIVEDRKRKRLE